MASSNEYLEYVELGEQYVQKFFTDIKYRYSIMGITFIFLSIHLLWGEFKELCIKDELFHSDMILLSQTGKGDIPFHIRRDTAFFNKA